jgi:hypothetical protein
VKLRQARKLDPLRHPSRKNRPWWTLHSPDTLDRAARRLHRSWARLTRWETDASGRTSRAVTPDWFAGNRCQSRAQVLRSRTVSHARARDKQ